MLLIPRHNPRPESRRFTGRKKSKTQKPQAGSASFIPEWNALRDVGIGPSSFPRDYEHGNQPYHGRLG